MARYGERPAQPRPMVLLMLILLVLQYLSGMTTNLFVRIPVSNQATAGKPFYRVWEAALRQTVLHGPLLPAFHVLLGVLLALLSLVILVSALIARNGVWIFYSLLGWLLTTTAAVNGLFFLSYGQHRLNAAIMSFVLIFAAAFYGIGYCVTRENHSFPRWRY
ncbi:MAG: hypothetical protein M0Z41_14835 [Peptococcaceae bacterium]|nr:hypothetical protein [Peptococcaceae bacterium]